MDISKEELERLLPFATAVPLDIDPEGLVYDLAHFELTGRYYTHWTGCFTYTDGVKYLADGAGAAWLIDLIASHQKHRLVAHQFQIWTLTVDDSKLPMAVAECRADKDAPVLVRQRIRYTDFPLPGIKLWLVKGCLMLPSKY